MARPRAYSYIRFSTPEQQKGDSLRRQLEASQKYAEEHGLDLDTDLTFRDLGVSAYRGRNVREGKLGEFVDAVREGRVPRGSYLLVESLDRLSRDRVMAALERFRTLLELGITVVTLQDRRVYTMANYDADFASLIISLSVMFRANEESATKSKRLKAAWEAKRKRVVEDGSKLTTVSPAWILATRDNGKIAYALDKDRAKIVKRIFKLTLDGIGGASIARRLNADGIPTFDTKQRVNKKSEGWHESYIKKILAAESVWGAYQPMRLEVDPETGRKQRIADGPMIEGYYPAVIAREEWLRAFKVREERRLASGPKGDRNGRETVSNLFTGLLRCGRCGASMHFINKGSTTKGGVKLLCSNAKRRVGNCKPPLYWSYPETEGYILALVKGVDWRELFPTIYAEAQEAITRLEDEETKLTSDLAKNEASTTALMEALEARPKSAALLSRLDRLEEERVKLTEQRDETGERLASERARQARVEENIKEAHDALSRWRGSVADKPDARYKMAAVLKKTLERITLTPAAEQTVVGPARVHGAIEIKLRDAEVTQRLVMAYAVGQGKKGVAARRWMAGDPDALLPDAEALLNFMRGDRAARVGEHMFKVLREFGRQAKGKKAGKAA